MRATLTELKKYLERHASECDPRSQKELLCVYALDKRLAHRFEQDPRALTPAEMEAEKEEARRDVEALFTKKRVTLSLSDTVTVQDAVETKTNG